MNEKAAANPLGTERVGKLMIRYAIPLKIFMALLIMRASAAASTTMAARKIMLSLALMSDR